MLHDFYVDCKVGNATCSPTNATFKLNISVIDEDSGKAVSKEAEDFKVRCYQYGLKPDGKTFIYASDVYTIEGLKTRSHKYPILCRKAGAALCTKFTADYDIVKELADKGAVKYGPDSDSIEV